VENEFAPGGRSSPPQGPPAPPRSTSDPGTLTPPPTVRGRPGTLAGCGPAASHPAGRNPRRGGLSGGEISVTASCPILSARPPRGAHTVAWDRTTCRTVGRRRVPGAASAGFPAATAGLPRSPTWWSLPPWDPTQKACPPGRSLAGHPRLGQGPSQWAPPRCLAGMSAPQGPMGASRLAGEGPMCHCRASAARAPHGECGPQGRHPVPPNRPLVAVLKGPLWTARWTQG